MVDMPLRPTSGIKVFAGAGPVGGIAVRTRADENTTDENTRKPQ